MTMTPQERKAELKKLIVLASINSINANWLTLFLAGNFGERKSTTIDGEYVVISKWREMFYLIDYVPKK